MEPPSRPLSRNNRGPRSRKLKAAVALAHLDHGLASNQIVLPTKDPAEWQHFHDDVMARFEPDGAVEDALASRVAEVLWRLRRIGRAEQQAVDVLQVYRSALIEDRGYLEEYADKQQRLNGEPDPGEPDIDEMMRQRKQWEAKYGVYTASTIASEHMRRHRETLPVLLPDAPQLELLMRYEAHLMRVLKHSLHELEALQDRRQDNPTPLARIDIN